MNYKTRVNLQEAESFNDVIQITVQFLISEYRPLFKILIILTGPIVFLYAFYGTWYSEDIQNFMKSLAENENTSALSIYTSKLFIYSTIISLVAVSSIITCLYTYVHHYVIEDKVDMSKKFQHDYWRTFLPVLGTFLLVIILIIFGLSLFIAPGIWVGTSLSIIFAVRIFEGKGFNEAFQRSFELTKHLWWQSFGLIMISYFVTIFSSFIVLLPLSIFQYFAPDIQPKSNLLFFVLSIACNIVSTFLIVIPFSAIAIQYFRLKKLIT